MRSRVLLVVAGLVLGVLLTEVAYRAARTQICVGRNASSLFIPNDAYGWDHEPGGEAWIFGCDGRGYEFSNQVRISDTGLRDHDTSYPKPPGTQRVLLLGDSMTEALQVPLEETFSELTERQLKQSMRNVEVLNGACSAYGTDNELLYYRHEGVRYEADVVVLVLFTRNDVIDVSSVLHPRMALTSAVWPKRYFSVDESGALVLGDPPTRDPSASEEGPLARAYGYLQKRLFLLRAIEQWLPSPATKDAVQAPSSSGPSVSWQAVYARVMHPEIRKGWQLIEKLLEELRTDVERSNAKLLVAIMPAKEEVALAGPMSMHPPIASQSERWDLDQANRITRRMLDRLEIDYLDLRPSLRDHTARTGETGYFSVDIHLNADGHRVVASELAPWLEAQFDSSSSGSSGSALRSQ